MIRTVVKERFRAQDDAGKQYTVIVYENLADGGEKEFPVSQRLFVAGGGEVFPVSDHVYQLYGTETVLNEIL